MSRAMSWAIIWATRRAHVEEEVNFYFADGGNVTLINKII